MTRVPPSRTTVALMAMAAVLSVAVAMLVWRFDWNWFKAPIERIVFARTGIKLHIDGDLSSVLSMHPTIRAGRVRVANAPWANEPWGLVAEQVALTVALRSIFSPPIIVENLELIRPIVALERTKDGRGSWQLGKSSADASPSVRVERLRVDGGSVHFQDAQQSVDIRATGGTESNTTSRFMISGTVRAQPLKASVVLRVAEADPINGSIGLVSNGTIGELQWTLNGDLGPQLNIEGKRFEFSASGSDLSRLRELFKAALPALVWNRMRPA